MNTRECILGWLGNRLDSGTMEWLRSQCALLENDGPTRALHLAYGQVLRRVGRAPLDATADEQAVAYSRHSGWQLQGWTLEQAARAALLLSLPDTPASRKAVLELFQTADLGEHVALVRSLFLLPGAPHLLHIAREGVRSNMGDVFEAVSQRNPYPAEYFDDIAWNQMIVKCLFVGLPLGPVFGLDRRVNAELSRMIAGLARERWAAGRDISPEAWRCVGPFAGADEMTVMASALERGSVDRRAAALGLLAVPGAKGLELLQAKSPELIVPLQAGTLTWENYDQL